MIRSGNLVENWTGIEHFFPRKIKPDLGIFFREKRTSLRVYFPGNLDQFSSFTIPLQLYIYISQENIYSKSFVMMTPWMLLKREKSMRLFPLHGGTRAFLIHSKLTNDVRFLFRFIIFYYSNYLLTNLMGHESKSYKKVA